MGEKWNYDERGGMVAVYAGEPRNCLANGGPFIFSSYFERDLDHGGYIRDEQACTVAKTLVDQHDRIAVLEGDLAECNKHCSELDSINESLNKDLAAAKESESGEAKRLREGLRRLEWCIEDDDHRGRFYCPSCGAKMGEMPHLKNCWLAELL